MGTDLATDRDVLNSKSLSQTLLSNGNDGWASDSLTVTAGMDYDVLIAVIRSQAWPGDQGDIWNYGIRGIDNVSLVASVPEPVTMLLLGVGLVGLAGVGRKKLFKK
jgi:hypothetical protein